MRKQKKVDVLKIKKDSVIDHMRSLRSHAGFEIWLSLMADQQQKIIEDGKKAKGTEAEAAWARLDGFDRGFSLALRWADAKKDSEREQTADPFE